MNRAGRDHYRLSLSVEQCGFCRRVFAAARHAQRHDTNVSQLVRCACHTDYAAPALVAQHRRLVPVDGNRERPARMRPRSAYDQTGVGLFAKYHELERHEIRAKVARTGEDLNVNPPSTRLGEFHFAFFDLVRRYRLADEFVFLCDAVAVEIPADEQINIRRGRGKSLGKQQHGIGFDFHKFGKSPRRTVEWLAVGRIRRQRRLSPLRAQQRAGLNHQFVEIDEFGDSDLVTTPVGLRNKTLFAGHLAGRNERTHRQALRGELAGIGIEHHASRTPLTEIDLSARNADFNLLLIAGSQIQCGRCDLDIEIAHGADLPRAGLQRAYGAREGTAVDAVVRGNPGQIEAAWITPRRRIGSQELALGDG